MKRWTFRILLVLILGVITTVAVAWGCTARAYRIPSGPNAAFTGPGNLSVLWDHIDSLPAEHQRWIRSHFPDDVTFNVGVDADPAYWSDWVSWTDWMIDLYDETGFREMRYTRVPTVGMITGQWVRDGAHSRAGWPLPAVHSSRVRPLGSSWSREHNVIGALSVPGPFDLGPLGEFTSFELACIPVCPGFPVNTLIYGAIWFGLLFSVGATRRAIRRTRGRCPRCGYNLRGEFDDGCPECGWNRTCSKPHESSP